MNTSYNASLDGATIGVLGGSGETGGYAVADLVATSGCRVLLGGRNPDNAKAVLAANPDRVWFQQVDLFQSDSLERFCSACDLILNCAGPSVLIGDRVAVAALRSGRQYVDVGGYEPLDESLKPRQDELRKKGLCFVITAGMLPGVSGVLTRLIANRAEAEMDQVGAVTVHYAVRDEFTFNSLRDIIYNAFLPLGGVFRNGKWVQVLPLLNMRSFEFPALGKQSAAPWFMSELKRFAEEKKYPEFGMYMSGSTFAVLWRLMFIRAFLSKTTELGARMLMKTYHKQLQGIEPANELAVRVQGRKAGQPVELRGLLSTHTSYQLSGVAAAVTARLVLQGHTTGPGGKYLCDAVDPECFMALIAERQIPFQVVRPIATT